MAKRKRPVGKQHVRIYAFEMATVAWKSLTPNARALLIEFRSLYAGQDNRIFLSVRQMAERLGVSVKPAQKARDELIERRWIRLITLGSFTRKMKHATVYALENEPIHGHDGEPAPKGYMFWQPTKQKSPVVKSTTDGSHFDHRGDKKSA